MLNRLPSLPLPPVFGCVLTQTASAALANRFIETKLPDNVVNNILKGDGGKLLLGYQWVLVSSGSKAYIVDPSTPVRLILNQKEPHAV